MGDLAALLLACGAGFALGALFFGGLWWTVRKALSAKRPALWFLTSMLLRTGFTLAGFYFVADGRWNRLLLSLFGFLIARFLITRLTAPPVQSRTHRAEEAAHAP